MTEAGNLGAVVYVTATLPWPIRSGGHLRTHANLAALASLTPTHLVAFPFGGGEAPPLPLASTHVLPVPPSPVVRRVADRAAGFVRGVNPYLVRFRRAGGLHVLEKVVRTTGATVVVLEYPFYPWVAQVLRTPGRRFVADVADDRIGLARQVATSAQSVTVRARAVLDLASLVASERRLDGVHQAWFAASADAAAAARRHRDVDVRTIPNVVDTERISAVRTHVASESAAFLGSFDYPPNALAAERFVRRLTPLLRRERPDCRLGLIGRAPTEELRKMALDVGVELHADVPDALETLAQYAVMVVPMDVGSGTRLKILEALGAGIAVVTTTIGMAGLDLEPGHDLLCADDDASISAAVVRLWSDPELRERIVRGGRESVVARYSHATLRSTMAEALGSLSRELPTATASQGGS